MNNTVAMNTLTGAVSEYTGFGFQSITPTHAGSTTGLFTLGGGTYEIRALYLELDHLGTPRQARRDGGTIVWRCTNRGQTLRFPLKQSLLFNMLRSSLQAKTEHAWHFGATFFVVETNNEACHACERNRSAGCRAVSEVFAPASSSIVAARCFGFALSACR